MILYTNRTEKRFFSIVISVNIKLLFLGFRKLTRQGKQGNVFRGHGEYKLFTIINIFSQYHAAKKNYFSTNGLFGSLKFTVVSIALFIGKLCLLPNIWSWGARQEHFMPGGLRSLSSLVREFQKISRRREINCEHLPHLWRRWRIALLWKQTLFWRRSAKWMLVTLWK